MSSPQKQLSAAFTLIELLVSFAVLAALVTLLASTFSNFAGLTSASGKRMEANNQIRTVFDRMGFDLGASVRTGGMTMTFGKNKQISGSDDEVNDSVYMLADARSTEADSRLARIGYEVAAQQNEATSVPVEALLRCVEPFRWNDSTTDTRLGSNAQKQPLGWGVFRMEFSFLKTDGNIVANPPVMDELAAVICSTASLDEKTYARLNDDQRESLAKKLPDARDGRLPIADWKADLFDGLPAAVKQNVRFQQRQFSLR